MAPTKPAKSKKPAAAATTKITKVFWKKEERQLLAEQAAFAMRQSASKMSPLEALRRAQESLPENRRRSLHSVGEKTEPWYMPALAAELRKLQQREIEEAAKPAKVVGQPVLDIDIPAEQAAQAPEVITPPAHVNGTAVEPARGFAEAVPAGMGQAFMNLRGMLVDELASVFLEAMLKAIGSGLLTHGETPQVQVAESHGIQRLRIAPKLKKPAILVVGLNGSQKTEIEREYGDRFDLRFYSTHESKDLLRSMTEKADTTVLVTDFISHSHEDIVKSRSPHYVRSPGGLTSLRQTLTNLAH